MINMNLVLTSLFWCGLALLVFELIWFGLERSLDLLKKLPSELVEKASWGYFFSRYILQLSFLVLIPTAIYSLFYMLLPFYGTRAGVATALALFVLGIIPFALSIFLRMKLPLSYILFQMAGFLLKLLLIFGIIGYLYVL